MYDQAWFSLPCGEFSRSQERKQKFSAPSVGNISSSHMSWQFCSLDASTNVYLLSQGLFGERSVAIKVLLITYNAPGHPQPISIKNDITSVVFLPPKTTSLLQPIDQNNIRCVKASYTRQFLQMFRKS
jgi:hypothetical protein